MQFTISKNNQLLAITDRGLLFGVGMDFERDLYQEVFSLEETNEILAHLNDKTVKPVLLTEIYMD